MTRTLSWFATLAILASPSTAWADVPPQPIPFMSVSEAIIIGCIILGLVLAVFAYRTFRPNEDDQESDQASP